ncbi:MAG: hypothetical protein GTN35_01285 [Nitrososphaeria archaeon]|nr:hypothetical protein [Nitrosopumilaceae archaeon]NIP10063.1 hypothetical protein [Nitrosopumilaceae archaeon]NIP91040.1 hypothetical protein [Nitrososphaeria archaeon]NIS94859.1 hypothetical protein [Nitrosopumilaceae archaeon]
MSLVSAKEILLNNKVGKAIEIAILALSSVYFVGFVLFDTQSIGLPDLYPKPENFEAIFDGIIWAIFVVMIPDLTIKYLRSENWKKFLRNYWIDVMFFVLIPLFAWLRILKVLQFVNQLKTFNIVKSLLKVIYDVRQVLIPLLLGYRLIRKFQEKRKK